MSFFPNKGEGENLASMNKKWQLKRTSPTPFKKKKKVGERSRTQGSRVKRRGVFQCVYARVCFFFLSSNKFNREVVEESRNPEGGGRREKWQKQKKKMDT